MGKGAVTFSEPGEVAQETGPGREGGRVLLPGSVPRQGRGALVQDPEQVGCSGGTLTPEAWGEAGR